MANENNSNKTKKIFLDSEYLKSIIDEEEEFVDNNNDDVINPDKDTTMNIQLAGETLNINASSIQEALVSCFQSTYTPVEVPKNDVFDSSYIDSQNEDENNLNTIRYNKNRVNYVQLNKLKYDMDVKEVRKKRDISPSDYIPSFNYKKIVICVIVGVIGVTGIYFVSKIDFKAINVPRIENFIGTSASKNHFYDKKLKTQDESKVEAIILEYYETMKENPIVIDVEGNNYDLDITKILSKEKIKEFSKKIVDSEGKQFTFVDMVSSEDINLVINDIYSKYCTDASEPRFEINNDIVVVKDGVVGKNFNKDNLYNEILENLKSYNKESSKIKIELVESKPTMTATSLKNINSVVSENSIITVSGINSTELNNIANIIDNIVINPNETFSLLDILGQFNLSSEYLSQIATGIYNAQLKLGIKPVEKTNNSIEGIYAPKGLDAFVDKDNDYKFKNTLKEPIAISISVKDDILDVKLLSNQSVLDNKVYKPIVEKVADKEYSTYLEVYDKEDKLFENKLDKILIDNCIYD